MPKKWGWLYFIFKVHDARLFCVYCYLIVRSLSQTNQKEVTEQLTKLTLMLRKNFGEFPECRDWEEPQVEEYHQVVWKTDWFTYFFKNIYVFVVFS